jgi:thiol-disulfide isomerase/thioredoxin
VHGTVTNNSAKTPRALLAGLIILSAGALGYVAYQLQAFGRDAAPRVSSDPPNPVPAPAAAESAGSPAEDGTNRKSVPDTLPDITLANLDGKPTRLASFGGRPLMINFWATWCAPCRREIPLLNKIRAQRKAQNAEIVGIAVDFTDDVLQYVKTTPISYPLLMGEEDGLAAAESFGMGMAFPFSVFVDSENRILTIKVGELHEDEANFAFDRLRDIDNGVLTREAAQAAVADAFREMAAARAHDAHSAEETVPK